MPSNNGTAVRAARPTIHVDGRDRPELTDGLLGLTIVEQVAGLYRCEAMFGNWGSVNGRIGYVYFDRQLLEFGKPFQVIYQDELLFEGRIMGLEALFPETGLRSITVLAEDRFQDLRMTRRTRTFVDVSDADVIRQIAGNHGLTHQVDLPQLQHQVLAQVNQSDLAFIRERARTVDGEVWMEGNKLHAVSHSARGQDTVELVYREDLREFSALADLANQRSGVTVSGWDVAGKQAISHQATERIISNELNGDVSGVSILQEALGSRKEQLSHSVPLTAQEAQARAEAFFKMSARRFVTARGLANVQPKMRAGVSVRLQQLGPLFSGQYYVTEVRHLFDRTGIRTEFTAERAGLGRE
jgi:phage protein D